jgi:hypothetical protein
MMQRLNFGRIEQLQVRDGLPVLNPPPRVIREHKFGGDNQPRPELDHGDFPLKRQVIELLDTMTRLRTGLIEVLEVKHGLPFHMTVIESVG